MKQKIAERGKNNVNTVIAVQGNVARVKREKVKDRFEINSLAV